MVELLEPATQHYALVRMPDGKEVTGSLSDLSPAGSQEGEEQGEVEEPIQSLELPGQINNQVSPIPPSLIYDQVINHQV